MKADLSPGLKEELLEFYNAQFSKIIKVSDIKSYNQLLSIWMNFCKLLVDSANTIIQKQSENFTGDEKTRTIEQIEAQSVIIEVVDQKTGYLFRRKLPMKYFETDNGIILSGENSNGSPSDITFLSDTALERINDLTGKGPDTPRCGH